MSLEAEIGYVANMARVLNVPASEVRWYLRHKPFVDPNRATYLADIAQILALLPPPPLRLLDLGCGSGWTSELFAASGYQVLGTDVAPDMIGIASLRCREGLDLEFRVTNFESPIATAAFDIVVLYDALHHATDAAVVIRSAHAALTAGGLFISVEPGRGHADTEATRDIVARFGTTERDMPHATQAALLADAGFGDIRQRLRLSQLVLEDVSSEPGRAQQLAHCRDLIDGSAVGLTSVVTARKPSAA
jgi:SAM-dependent methyltransferase